MSQRDDILALAREARPVIERWLEISEQIAAFRELATEKQIEWSQLKAVLVAEARDNEDGGKRLQKLADTADNRLSYAGMFLKSQGPSENKIKLSDRPTSPDSRASTPSAHTESRADAAPERRASEETATDAPPGHADMPPRAAPSTDDLASPKEVEAPSPDDDLLDIPTFLRRAAPSLAPGASA